MRYALPAFALLLSGAAAAATFDRLPPPSHPDTEVATNVPFAFAREHAGRFAFTLDLDATPSNNVEVAFGADADADGVLQPEEAALSFAWDCGRWILRGASAEPAFAATSRTDVVRKSVSWSLRLARGTRPWRLSLSENGQPLFPELAANPPPGLFAADWNLVRVVTRGVDAPDEDLSVVVQPDSFIFRLR